MKKVIEEVETITPEYLNEYKQKQEEADWYKGAIVDRIDYILKSIFDFEGGSLNYWYFDGASEGEVGDFSYAMGDNEIYNIITEGNPFGKGYNYILKDGKVWKYEGSIPSRWLFEDFEEELVKGKESFDRREEEQKKKKKEASESKKIKNQMLAEQAKAKLSKEELLALKQTL